MNDGVKLVFIIVYILANIALFLDGYLKYVLAPANGDPGLDQKNQFLFRIKIL